MKAIAILLLVCVVAASATVYFQEDFDAGWEQRWVKSKHKQADGSQGDFRATSGLWHADENDKGLQTFPDARFFQISAKFPEFSNKDKTLVFQFSVKHEQKLDCGGGYLKLMPGNFNQEDFHGETPYFIMFGPDVCGSTTKRIHLIFNYKGTNHLWKKDIKCETDQLTHLYTLILNSDQTYKVLVDNEERAAGNLLEDWDFLPPKEIPDPNVSKPADWVDEAEIADPSAKKPEGWDDIPEFIADPDAKKPEDWDDELDGEWEAPMIDNPEYKGEWKPKMIPNPEYKGEWVHPMIPNPDYYEDNNLYRYPSNAFAGFEVWQVKAGTIFDNVIITDDINEANKLAEVTKKLQAAEKQAKEKQDEENRKRDEAEAKAAEEAADEEEEHEGKDEL